MKTNKDLVKRYLARVAANGPTRVVTEVDGDDVVRADPPSLALPDGHSFTIVYIRDDGWSLGACDQWAGAAKRLWADGWVAAYCPATGRAVIL